MHLRRLSLGIGLVLLLASEIRAAETVLNNFVTEHINVSVAPPAAGHDPAEPVQSFAFQSDREGWVFISAKTSGPGVRVALDLVLPEHAVLIVAQSADKPAETMRLIQEGEHQVHLFMEQPVRVDKLIVRSIPMTLISEISFAIIPNVRSATTGNYRERARSWEWYRRYVVPNVNVIASDTDRGKDEWRPYAEEFRALGRKWLYKVSFDWEVWKQPDAADTYYSQWGRLLEETPFLDGLLMDEFTTSEARAPAFPIFAEVFDRIAANPALQDKKMYIYGMYKPRDWYKPAVESMRRHRYPYMLERSERTSVRAESLVRFAAYGREGGDHEAFGQSPERALPEDPRPDAWASLFSALLQCRLERLGHVPHRAVLSQIRQRRGAT